MFGFKFVKFDPTDHIMLHKRGRLVREGAGLSFVHFAPTSSLVSVPMASVDVPFIFEEVTADFQSVSVQGQLTYRVADPKRLASMLNFTLESRGRGYVSDDPSRLPQRLINHVQVLTAAEIKTMPLRSSLVAGDSLVQRLRRGLEESEAITTLGVEILGLSILAIKPTPETARALEAEMREQLLREADEAIYARRNAAVEQERAIKENELNTEIAVENKQRQIRETKMEAEKSVQKKRHELNDADMSAQTALEKKRGDLVALATDNAKQEADARAYAVKAIVNALSEVDAKVLQSLVSVGMDPAQLVAAAFRDLAESAEKIGELNVSPDLLRELMSNRRKRHETSD